MIMQHCAVSFDRSALTAVAPLEAALREGAFAPKPDVDLDLKIETAHQACCA